MSRLEELIKELCPDGVPFKPIKEVYSRLKGTPITAGKMKEIDNPDGDIKIFAGGKTVINAMETDIPKANITRVPAVLVQSRGVIDFVYYEKPFTFKNEMWAYTAKEKISVKYLFHFLKNNVLHFRDAASGMGSLPQISLPVTEDFIIPVPPLPVQEEIVRILDTFSSFTTELKQQLLSEIQARKQQVDYYENIMFQKLQDENHCLLCEISTFVTVGIANSATHAYSDKGIVMFRNQNIKRNELDDSDLIYIDETFANKYLGKSLRENDILITRTGYPGQACLVPAKYEGAQTFTTLIVRLKPGIFPSYICRYINSGKGKEYVDTMKTGAAQQNFGAKSLEKMPIALPTYAEQVEIDSFLAKVDHQITSLETALLKEHKARQKQYEYYRDKLLTFKELA